MPLRRCWLWAEVRDEYSTSPLGSSWEKLQRLNLESQRQLPVPKQTQRQTTDKLRMTNKIIYETFRSTSEGTVADWLESKMLSTNDVSLYIRRVMSQSNLWKEGLTSKYSCIIIVLVIILTMTLSIGCQTGRNWAEHLLKLLFSRNHSSCMQILIVVVVCTRGDRSTRLDWSGWINMNTLYRKGDHIIWGDRLFRDTGRFRRARY